MNERSRTVSMHGVSRRSFLYGAGALLASTADLTASQNSLAQVSNTIALKRAARKSGKILGMFTVQHELLFDPVASAIIANTFSMIADGNDLKFANRLRPTPNTFDFSFGDTVVSWAEHHGMLFRGHCLVWWNALPNWFHSYVTPANAKQVVSDHITAVVKHFAGRVYSWDVVNEPIYHDNRPDGLRRRPWIDLIGPEYIDFAFQTAHAADPKARLVLNECYIEHDTPVEIGRRAALLALAARLKKASVPITTIGIQGHLRGNTALDKPGMNTFLKQIQDLGLEIMITEFDVDDIDVPAARIDQTVASKYGEFIELVGPFAKVITFEGLRDDPNLPRRSDGLPHRPNLLDTKYEPKPAYSATVRALMSPARG
ncbi:MAG: endo,4-beta-xylanase [Acidobacteriaceae bacterium]|jgi:endo-1,4-beta-xylanase|nr:endo,4-beta-xylanase [Acidobacteriaceae bacterium]MDX6462165.1 endo,4-beta-xylanase [Acidobacteriaceae bacterium]MEA2263095.1 endo,4-beta-xylanase [Acidobacteriaceae bacterium]MEA2543805.1 endo,4-beta-xylanase [Acidobacteriaceae bacterium]